MSLNIPSIRVLGLDVFGSVVRLEGVHRAEIKAYAAHIKQPEWSPLNLPYHWRLLPAFDDSREGIERLRKRFLVVPLTNGPVEMIAALMDENEIAFSAYFPLESHRVFKPDQTAYMRFCETFGCIDYESGLMVTANKDFGDLEGAAAVGMQSILIRGDDGGPQTLIELAELLGA